MERTRRLMILVFALVFGLTAGVANATQIYFEPFNYPPGTDLNGQDGGEGFDEPWGGPAEMLIAGTGSLIHPTLAITAS